MGYDITPCFPLCLLPRLLSTSQPYLPSSKPSLISVACKVVVINLPQPLSSSC